MVSVDEDIDIDIAIDLHSTKNVHPLESQSDVRKQPPAKKKKLVTKKVLANNIDVTKKTKSMGEQPKTTSQEPKKKTTSQKLKSTSQQSTTTSQKPPATPSKRVSNNPSDDQSITEEAPPNESNESQGPRSYNYRDAEDMQICKSWLEVSQDPLNSTNQAGDTFWTRVAEHFTNVELSNKSGETLEDRFVSAMKLFQAIIIAENEQRAKKSKKAKKQPTKFTHMGCYHVLSHAQKWKDHCEEIKRKKIKEKKSSRLSSPLIDSGTHSQFTSDPLDDNPTSDAETIQSNRTGRAIGNKKAKELAAKLREDKKFKEDMLAVHRDLAKQTKAQNSILSVQQEAMTTLANNSIMQTDLATVSERSRPFYEWQQMKVLEKIRKEQADYEKKKKKEEKKSTKGRKKQKTQTGD
ncbi:hypothetical protein Pst134EA_019103 [Puccinia striiformis f. sp. tritici]|uniref:hypothetical protein n=1 Tax=Puccinia striiformis f. sp. tritici TaxID=168172 RepID=UPI002008A282|nr:hypothetical protein Pst134EA_019103 [Puccinia striiformis f. sp. tritici]KAH9458949.1 hypothetical protein Pst134EA_019103 [Puccinia striiformis f. sp. tritici]